MMQNIFQEMHLLVKKIFSPDEGRFFRFLMDNKCRNCRCTIMPKNIFQKYQQIQVNQLNKTDISTNKGMYHSESNKWRQRKEKFLNSAQFQSLTPEQREFAEQQLRMIYAEQISKLTTEIQHKKRINDNLSHIEELEQKNNQVQLQQLKNKMSLTQEKRSRNIEKKVKQSKQNDERWYNKLKEIQHKLKMKNREAIQKAQKYREDSEKYWIEKEKKMTEITKRHTFSVKKNDGNEQKPDLNKSTLQSKRTNKVHFSYHNPAFRKKTFAEEQKGQKMSKSRTLSKPQIEQQFSAHKQKSLFLQKQKQAFLFKKAFEKMEKIEKKRQQKAKKLENKVQPTKPRVANTYKQQNKKKKQYESHYPISNSNSPKNRKSLENLLKDHMQAKNKMQQKEFLKRGELMQENHKRNRKDKIKKLLREKIHDLKINAIKKENSKNNLF